MNLTQEEWTIIRKALQYTLNAHLSVEVFEGKEYRDTKIDALIRKIRAFEEAKEEHVEGEDVSE